MFMIPYFGDDWYPGHPNGISSHKVLHPRSDSTETSPSTDHWPAMPWLHGYHRPWAHHVAAEDSGHSSIASDKDMFKVTLDVQHFKFEELSVRTVGHMLVIEGHHEERPDDHGYIGRSFTRKYVLPPDVEAHHFDSSLSADGVLTLTAPKKVTSPLQERRVAIRQTGAPAVVPAAAKAAEVNGEGEGATQAGTPEQ